MPLHVSAFDMCNIFVLLLFSFVWKPHVLHFDTTVSQFSLQGFRGPRGEPGPQGKLGMTVRQILNKSNFRSDYV